MANVIASGPVQGVDTFWVEVQKHIRLDDVMSPGRYLSRDHLIFELEAEPRCGIRVNVVPSQETP